MDFIPPNAIGPIVATAITLLVTYFVAFVNNILDKNFKLLERDLQLKNNMKDTDASKVLDELIRRRLNSYVITEMNGRGRNKRSTRILYFLGIFWGLFLLLAIMAVIKNDYVEAGIWALPWAFFMWQWSEQAGKGKFRDFEENITYQANLHDGKFDKHYTKLPLLRPSYDTDTPDTWQYSCIYIQDITTEFVSVYEKFISSGYVFSDSKETTLAGEYRWIGGTKMTRKLRKLPNFISSSSLYDGPERPLSPLLEK